MADRNVRVTIIHPAGVDEKKVQDCALREYPGGMEFVSLPLSMAPSWAGQDAEVVVARPDGTVELTYRVHDTGTTDLSTHDVTELHFWNSEILNLYPFA